MVDSEKRRASVDRIFAAAAGRGQPVDDHPLFLAWVEEWVQGKIEIDELRDRYAGLKRQQQAERRQKLQSRYPAVAAVSETHMPSRLGTPEPTHTVDVEDDLISPLEAALSTMRS